MTLDEAISGYEELANECEDESTVEINEIFGYSREDCIEQAQDYRQLVEWLKELRKLKKCRNCPLVKEECKLCGFDDNEVTEHE